MKGAACRLAVLTAVVGVCVALRCAMPTSAVLEAVLCLAVAAALGAVLVSWLTKAPSAALTAVVAGLGAAAACVRAGHSYFWDEWDLLLKFGSASVPAAHNEHSLPLYLPLLKSLYTWVGESYYVLLLLHGGLLLAAALLCYLILREFFSESAASITAVLYVLNAQHAETTSWGLLLGLSISQLLFVLTAWLLLCSRIRRRTLLVGVLCFISPFFSMLGWLAAPQLVLLLVWAKFCKREFTLLPRVVPAAAGWLSALAVFHYSLGGVPGGAVHQSWSLGSFLKYLLVGSEVGSGLRTFGLFASTSIDHALPAELLGVSEWTLFLMLSIAGLCFTSALLAVSFSNRLEERTAFLAFFYYKASALLWIAPAIAIRTAEKARGALSPRYHGSAVFSASMFMAGLLDIAKGWSEGRAHRRYMLAVLLTLFCWSHLFAASQFRSEERKQWTEVDQALEKWRSESVEVEASSQRCAAFRAIDVSSISPYSSAEPIVAALEILDSAKWSAAAESARVCANASG